MDPASETKPTSDQKNFETKPLRRARAVFEIPNEAKLCAQMLRFYFWNGANCTMADRIKARKQTHFLAVGRAAELRYLEHRNA